MNTLDPTIKDAYQSHLLRKHGAEKAAEKPTEAFTPPLKKDSWGRKIRGSIIWLIKYFFIVAIALGVGGMNGGIGTGAFLGFGMLIAYPIITKERKKKK